MLLLKLFFAFIQVGMFSVGGGYAAIPLIQEQIVNIYGLMSMEEFSDLITVAEMTPGPISINSATFVGMRLAGIPDGEPIPLWMLYKPQGSQVITVDSAPNS